MIQMTLVDFISTSELLRSIVTNLTVNMEGDKVQWLKISYLLYEKENSFVVSYKYGHVKVHVCQKLDLGKGNYN